MTGGVVASTDPPMARTRRRLETIPSRWAQQGSTGRVGVGFVPVVGKIRGGRLCEVGVDEVVADGSLVAGQVDDLHTEGRGFGPGTVTSASPASHRSRWNNPAAALVSSIAVWSAPASFCTRESVSYSTAGCPQSCGRLHYYVYARRLREVSALLGARSVYPRTERGKSSVAQAGSAGPRTDVGHPALNYAICSTAACPASFNDETAGRSGHSGGSYPRPARSCGRDARQSRRPSDRA